MSARTMRTAANPAAVHRRQSGRLAAAAWLLLGVGLGGCSVPSRTIALSQGAQSAETLLAAHPPKMGQNITPYLIEKTDRTSTHLIWVREGEKPHYHAVHDLVVILLRGHGTLWLRDSQIPMREGDVADVPAGTPHHFVNGGSEPAAAFAVFTPPSDGSDTVPLGP